MVANGEGYQRITVEIGHEAMEAVADFLVSAGAGGVEYEEGPTCKVSAYFRPEESERVLTALRLHLDQLPRFGLHSGEPKITTTFVADADWAHAWREFYHVHRIGRRIVIRPVWEEYTPSGDDIVIDMDPGMAFGTGQHETTALCLSAMDELVQPGHVVADIGTGSGILAIAAAKLGAARVDAVDVDPEAVAVARRNVVENGVDERVHIVQGDAAALNVFNTSEYDLVVMNIVADVIIASLPQVVPHITARTTLLLSGIIHSRQDDVARALAEHGLTLRTWERRGEWLLARVRRAMKSQARNRTLTSDIGSQVLASALDGAHR